MVVDQQQPARLVREGAADQVAIVEGQALAGALSLEGADVFAIGAQETEDQPFFGRKREERDRFGEEDTAGGVIDSGQERPELARFSRRR